MTLAVQQWTILKDMAILGFSRPQAMLLKVSESFNVLQSVWIKA